MNDCCNKFPNIDDCCGDGPFSDDGCTNCAYMSAGVVGYTVLYTIGYFGSYALAPVILAGSVVYLIGYGAYKGIDAICGKVCSDGSRAMAYTPNSPQSLGNPSDYHVKDSHVHLNTFKEKVKKGISYLKQHSLFHKKEHSPHLANITPIATENAVQVKTASYK